MRDPLNPREQATAKPLSWTAMAAIAVMIAEQVSGKATRITLFLAGFHVTSLPWLMVTSALLGMLVAVVTGPMMRRLGPARWLPPGLLASAGLHLVESWLCTLGRPQPAAVVLYLHMAVIPVLISGFWSLLGAGADARENRRRMGRATSAACVGGVLGGALGMVRTATVAPAQMLPLLAMLHLICAGAVWRVRDLAGGPQGWETQPGGEDSPAQVLLGKDPLKIGPYLAYLALFVTALAAAGTFLDYNLAAQAQAAYPAEGRLHFFSAFYSVAAVVALLVYFFAGPLAVKYADLATTASTLPMGVIAGGLVTLGWPGITTAAIARGTEMVFRNSLYRSAYEPLFTAIPPRQRRAAKTVIDVGFDRAGDLLSGSILGLQSAGILASWPVQWAIALAAVGLVLARVIRVGYRDLLRRNIQLELVAIDPSQEILSESVVISSIRSRRTTAEQLPNLVPDDLAEVIKALASEDSAVVRGGIERAGALSPALVPYVLPLLGRDDVAGAATQALRRVANEHTGQLVDRLLDPHFDVAARRRIPRVLTASGSPRAIDGLLAGLDDPAFEIRHACGRALVRMRELDPALPLEKAGILSRVSREIDIEGERWLARQFLAEQGDPLDSVFLDERLRRRADRRLEHVFNLLALVLPQEELCTVFRALHLEDPSLIGIALEYLDEVLPRPIREKLLARLEVGGRPARPDGSQGSPSEAVRAARESVEISLTTLHERMSRPGGSPTAPHS